MRQRICDLCGKPTNRVVAKLLVIPLKGISWSRADYSGHADVGECCGYKVPTLAKFKKRVPDSRKKRKPAAKAA